MLSSCAADDRVLVETRTFTVDGHEIQVSTKACSANSITSRSFKKRQTLACGRRSNPMAHVTARTNEHTSY
jgi:hypothetical protein